MPIWKADDKMTHTKRHTIYIERNSFGLATRHCERSHLITLNNETAVNVVMEYLQSLCWLDGIISQDDVLVYDDELD